MLNSNSSLQRRGLSTYTNGTLTTEQTIVAAGTNTNGIIIRTIAGVIPSGQFLVVRAKGNTILLMDTVKNYLGAGFVIPPGQAMTVFSGAGGSIDVVLTYDLL
jgi:hypothetical protein